MSATHSRARALTAFGAALIAATAAAQAQSAPRIRIGAVATETFAEPLYAQDYGAFARAGLGVDLSLFASGAGVNQAMSGGALDVAACDPIQLMNAIDHGIPYQYFAGGLVHVGEAPTTVLCVAKSGPVKTAKDLEGQTIGIITLHNLAEFSIREWMTQQGADPSKARFIELTGPSMPAAVARGTVAAAMLIEPYLSMSAADTRVLANPYNSIADRFILNAFYARRDWLAQNAVLAKKLTGALYDAARWIDTHRTESLPILVKYGKFEPDKLATMRRATYATALDPALIAPVIEIAAKYKAVERTLPPADLIAKL
jgi:NitT/TauT family transport system substrate-binding protein